MLFIHQLVGIWIVSDFWLLWLMWTFVYKFRVDMCFHFSRSGITGTCHKYMFTFKEPVKLFLKWLYHFVFSSATHGDFLHMLPPQCCHSRYCVGCLTVAYVSISLITNVLNVFPCSYLSFLYLHWCGVYSDHLSVQILFVFSLSSKNPLYILDISSSSDVCLPNMF